MLKKIIKVGLVVACILAAIIFGLMTWATYSITAQLANVRVEKKSELIQKYQDEIDRVEIENADSMRISFWRFAQREPKGLVVVLHGMHGQDASSLLNLGYFFKEAKFETFCLDLRAHGYSEGDEIGFGYTEVKDVSALLDWIKADPRYDKKKIILYGISMGGATALNVAAEREDVDMVISVSAFKSYTDTFLDTMRREKVPELVVNLFRPSIALVLAAKYDLNFMDKSPIRNIARIKNTPVLLIHGDEDDQIPVEHGTDLKQVAGDNVELWIVDGANHMVVDEILAPNNDWYRTKVLSFIERNL